jgi:hypothetical protein
MKLNVLHPKCCLADHLSTRIIICYVHTCALSRFHTAFVNGMPFGACHGPMLQPALTCASVVVQLVTSANGEFSGGI